MEAFRIENSFRMAGVSHLPPGGTPTLPSRCDGIFQLQQRPNRQTSPAMSAIQRVFRSPMEELGLRGLCKMKVAFELCQHVGNQLIAM